MVRKVRGAGRGKKGGNGRAAPAATSSPPAKAPPAKALGAFPTPGTAAVKMRLKREGWHSKL